MVNLIENGHMEVFENKEDFIDKYGEIDAYEEIDWCESNKGKILTKQYSKVFFICFVNRYIIYICRKNA